MSPLQTIADFLLSRYQRIPYRNSSEQLIGLDAEDVEVFHISNVMLTKGQSKTLALVALEFRRSAIKY